MLAERDWREIQDRAVGPATPARGSIDPSLEDLVHDLKGPLASIRGLLFLALLETSGPLSPAQRDLLEHARGASERLLDTIAEATLESWIAVGGTGRRPDSVDLLGVTRDVMTRFRVLALERDVALLGSGIDVALPRVSANRLQITRVVENLVQNAVKFSRPGGRVWVETALADGYVGCSIHDEGVGIPTWAVPYIFERRFRVPNAGEGPEGTGLGLSICRRIVEAYGGRIWAESAEGAGTTVSFTLPIPA